MSKILISWIALNNDFNHSQVAFDGPTYRFHKHFFKGYDKHLLLTTEKEGAENERAIRLYSTLVKEFRDHKIEIVYLNIPQAEVVDFNRLHAAVYPILAQHIEFDIDIFVSPGTATMHVVWHMIHLEGIFKTRLLQTIKPEDLKAETPKLLEIQMRPSPRAEYLVLQEKQVETGKREYSTETYLISEALKPVYDLVDEVAVTNKTTVLIQGETGTGKEHVAREIHNRSRRKDKPFVAVNCAAIAPDILESRLFGHERGAFTGALKKSEGYFHAANGGTIFLDEIGDINPYMQVALLRILQEGELQRVGNTKVEHVNVRVIGATNKNLYEECQNGKFRWDLYYRLSVADIFLPPLRVRGEYEIEQLLGFFNRKVHQNLEKTRKLLTFTPKAMKTLLAHSWPGNVRELQNFIERCYAHGLKTVEPMHLPTTISLNATQGSLKFEDIKRSHVQKVFNQCNQSLVKTMEILDVGSVNTVKKYLENKGDFRG